MDYHTGAFWSHGGSDGTPSLRHGGSGGAPCGVEDLTEPSYGMEGLMGAPACGIAVERLMRLVPACGMEDLMGRLHSQGTKKELLVNFS